MVNVALPDNPTEMERVKKLQDAGTKLRKKFGNTYLAEKCVSIIAVNRLESNGYIDVSGNKIPTPRRHAYIIDSLKHPDEVQLLQDVYGGIFWLFGIFAPEEVRKERLRDKGVPKNNIDELIEVDEEEGINNGQKVRDTIQVSDFFIRNDEDNTERLLEASKRYLRIIFGTNIETPTKDEAAMYAASASATGSACMSRQVGAAIFNNNGQLIGIGRNDVPKANGGLYECEDGKRDHRCFKWKGKRCHNEHRKDMLYNDIYVELVNASLVPGTKKVSDIKSVLKKTDIKNLIEYSRAVHAEMEAILSVARGSAEGIVGSTLYCTTFPCHNCARHIVASGICRVVYVEPYPKSLATALHSDSISTKANAPGKVSFVQYEGVAPKNILRLFQYRSARKQDGKLIPHQAATAKPVSRSPLDGFFRREQIVVERLEQIEKGAQVDGGE